MFTNFIGKYWKSVTFTIVILLLSFMKTSAFSGIPTVKYSDKIVHLLLYIFYSAVLYYDFRKSPVRTIVYVSIVYPIVLGGIIEIMQGTFFKPRSAEWIDWFCDILGALLGYFVMYLILKNKHKITRTTS